jgi:FkbM family methyltransferase
MKIIDQLNKIPYYDEKGEKINTKVEEIDEQVDAEQYIKPDDIVLEVGARYGTVSNVINTILKNKTNHIVIEPDDTVINALTKNRDSHGCKFQIFNGYISNKNKKIIYKDYATHLVDIDEKGGEDLANKRISYTDLKKKYNLDFNVLVIDCEGCMEELILDIGKDIKNYNKIFFEKDFPHKSNYEFIKNYLLGYNFNIIKYGFRCIYTKNIDTSLVFPKISNYNLIKVDRMDFVTNYINADLISEIIKKYRNVGENITILDSLAGFGGQTISFAKYFDNVIAIEMNPIRFDMLKNNIFVYNLKNTKVYNLECISYLYSNYENVDVIYFDPYVPYLYNKYKLFKIGISVEIRGQTLYQIISFLKNVKKELCIVIKLPTEYNYDDFKGFEYKKFVINNFNILIF